jgi:hypothetical protein
MTPGTGITTATITIRCAPEAKTGAAHERNIRAATLDEFVFGQGHAALLGPGLLLVAEQAIAVHAPVPHDQLLAAELAPPRPRARGRPQRAQTRGQNRRPWRKGFWPSAGSSACRWPNGDVSGARGEHAFRAARRFWLVLAAVTRGAVLLSTPAGMSPRPLTAKPRSVVQALVTQLR